MIAGRSGARVRKVRLGLGRATWVGGGARGTPGSACLNQREPSAAPLRFYSLEFHAISKR
jgi:hypothetical protein